MTRITKSNIEYYISLVNAHMDRNIELDIAYGGYKLVWSDTHNEITPYRMTCRECYYCINAMFNTIVGLER